LVRGNNAATLGNLLVDPLDVVAVIELGFSIGTQHALDPVRADFS